MYVKPTMMMLITDNKFVINMFGINSSDVRMYVFCRMRLQEGFHIVHSDPNGVVNLAIELDMKVRVCTVIIHLPGSLPRSAEPLPQDPSADRQ